MDIDFVVLWVDGSDPVWQAEKAKYQGKTLDDSNAVNRFRDWGLMPYWFRAVERFAPWVRKIHFVTCGHVPAFLNLAHPKLHHVKHADFLPPKRKKSNPQVLADGRTWGERAKRDCLTTVWQS